VRFLLSPPPEEENMKKTRSSSQSPVKKAVLPTAPKEEEWKFGAASRWDSEHLSKLRVSLWRERKLNLEKFLNIDENNWTQEMKKGQLVIFNINT